MWDIDLLQLVVWTKINYLRKKDLEPSLSLGQSILNLEKDQKSVLTLFWNFNMIHIYIALLTNDFRYLNPELNAIDKVTICPLCGQGFTRVHRKQCDPFDLPQYQIRSFQFFHLYQERLETFVKNVKQLMHEMAPNNPRQVTGVVGCPQKLS